MDTTKRTTPRKGAPKPKARQMPKFTRPPAALVDLFQRAIGPLPGVATRQMFGFPAAFTNGQMFSCLFNDDMIVRMSPPDRETLVQKGAQLFEPTPGRPMREYVVVPDAVRVSPLRLHEWLIKGHAYVRSLPPRKKR